MIWRISSGVMAGLFLVGALVQINDPDPLRWMGVYGAAALVSAVAASGGRTRVVWPAAIGGVALGWGGVLMLGVEGGAFGSMFDAWEMASVPIEEAREASGLVVIAGWMAVLACRAWLWGRPVR